MCEYFLYFCVGITHNNIGPFLPAHPVALDLSEGSSFIRVKNSTCPHELSAQSILICLYVTGAVRRGVVQCCDFGCGSFKGIWGVTSIAWSNLYDWCHVDR